MPSFVILRQAHTPSAAFDLVREQLRMSRQWGELDEADGKMPEWELLQAGAIGGECFERAAAFLSKSLQDRGELTALVDEVDPLRLDPIASNGWDTLISMLILAFPEVRWHFLVVTGSPQKDPADLAEKAEKNLWQRFHRLHGLKGLHEARGTPLFDGFGLRQHILDCMEHREKEQARNPGYPGNASVVVPKRKKIAILLDDEPGYSWLHACMAHRHGFRAHAISSWDEALHLLGHKGLLTPAEGDEWQAEEASSLHLSLEDWFLSYPDQNDRNMSNLELRSKVLPALSRGPFPLRRFLTVGHEIQSARTPGREQFLRGLRQIEMTVTGRIVRDDTQVAYKPASGFYTLWQELGLKQAFTRKGERKEWHGLAEGFHWPPLPPTNDGYGGDDESGGHSAPGRLVQIADHLLQRAAAFVDSVNTVTEAVRGAALSTQALELLGCKTPTLSVDALLLKHEFEVNAECQFVGMEYHFSMKERLADIRRNLEAMSLWLHPRCMEEFKLNAEAMILTRLVATLSEYGKFEESQACQRRLRTLHHKITHQHDLRHHPIFALASWPFRAYIEFVLRSLGHYTLAITLLALGFSVAFAQVKACGLADGFHTTLLAFVDGSIQEEAKGWERVVAYLAACAGVLNFGLLVSYLYSKIARQ